MSKEYDLLIIGYGAAAFSAAIKASEITSGQASIAMVGTGPLGGTCVNVGCVPSKMLISAARNIMYMARPRYPGIEAEYRTDSSKILEFIRQAVGEERHNKYETVVSGYENIDLYRSRAVFTGDRKISIEDGTEIFGYNVIIGTGSRPSIPPIQGLKDAGYITSNEFWSLEKIPGELVIIGSGPIGSEIGQAAARIGSRVKIIEIADQILPGIPRDMAQKVMESMVRDGIEFHLSSAVKSVSVENGKKIVRFETGGLQREVEADEILVATGRSPNVDLDLEKTGVQYDRYGIVVDGNLRTSNRKIYAAGDVVKQRFKLETLAAKQGVIAAENIFNRAGIMIDLSSFPLAIFTDPEYASVGYTEDEARSAGLRYDVRAISTGDVAKERILRNADGIIRMIVEQGTKRILGIQMVAENAADMINEASVIIHSGMTVDDVIDTPHVFPTVNEGLKLAAQSFLRDISMMSCCME
ncbi:mercury(II) reductase [Thermoplasma sp.]|uniref:mercury(II) reductase n=1 Tax=Thermoplasma sp. TaxID=1973142 RepID=UPI0012845832|nr:mercury(II) reductase [Thermoplasma sp.]KAA8922720.1 MAG: mercury(II) reductase [Thermoplasma sp.]